MRGRVVGGIQSHTKAVHSIIKSTPRQLNPDASNGVTRNQINKPTLPTHANKTRILLPIEESVSVKKVPVKKVPVNESVRAEEPPKETNKARILLPIEESVPAKKVPVKKVHEKKVSENESVRAEEPPKETVLQVHTEGDSTVVPRAKVLLRNLKPGSPTSGDDGVKAEKPPSESVSESCAAGNDMDVPRVKVKPGDYVAEECTREGYVLEYGEEAKTVEIDKSGTQGAQRWVFQLIKFPVVNPKNLPQNLLFVSDSKTNVIFLVDSGSEISVLPKVLTNGAHTFFAPQSRTIQGFGSGMIHPIGSVDVQLQLGELDPIKHTFWVTEEPRSYGIIGLDMLVAHQLAIFPSTSQLCKIGSGKSAKMFAAAELPTPIVTSINMIELANNENPPLEEKCKRLLLNYPEITKKPTYHTKPKHNHELEIVLDDYKAMLIKPRRAGGRRAVIEEHFIDLLQRGVVVRGEGNQGASPVTCVQKKDGTMRVCVDYTRLNAATRPLCYPLPRIDELSEIIPGGTRYFSNIDLKEAYYSLPLSVNSRKCAAIIVPNGVFIPNRCVFGLKNAPMKFQMMMECILRECKGFTYVYLDDILIFSRSEQEHVHHVNEVLKVLSENGLFLNVKKSTFAKAKLEFLGHVIGVDGIDVQSSKVKAIKEYPIPITRRELRSYLGMCNYYHRFVPHLAEITSPLSEVSGGPKKTNRTILKLNDIQTKAFEDTKNALANAATLSFEKQDKPLILFSDASDSHVGAVLEGDQGEMVPLTFFSRSIPVSKLVRCTYY